MTDILVIDDDLAVRKLLCQMFEKEGYEVSEASDGDKGLKVCRVADVKVVITELILPGTDGIEAIVQIRQDFPHVKIIAISGGGKINSSVYLDLAKALGASRTFAKPIDRKKLLAAVKKLV